MSVENSYPESRFVGRNAKRRSAAALLLAGSLLVLPASGLVAQDDDLRLPVSLDADSTAYDGKSSMLMFRGLRLTQGNIGIEADEGRASNARPALVACTPDAAGGSNSTPRTGSLLKIRQLNYFGLDEEDLARLGLD